MVAPDNRSAGDAPSGPVFWTMLVVGWAIMAFGIRGLILQPGSTNPETVGPWFVGSALAHDFLLAPVVFLAGAGVARAVPARVRPFVQAGLIISGMVVAVALPQLIGLGGQPGNDSALPHDYRAGLAMVLAAIWAGVLVIYLVNRVRRNRR